MGRFWDFYGNGPNTSATNANQQFFTPFDGLQLPLIVLEPNGMPMLKQYDAYGTQGVYYTKRGTKIDNYYPNPFVNPRNTPCDPPRPAL